MTGVLLQSSEGIGAVHHLLGGTSNTPELSKTEMDSRPTCNSIPSRRNTQRRKDRSKIQYCYWKFGTINVLSASDDIYLHECLRQCTLANLDICCFQEFRRLGHDSITVPITIDEKITIWNLWWCGHKHKRQHGVAIAIRSSKSITVEEISNTSPRMIWIDCICYGIKIRIVSAYSPTEAGVKSQKDSFYSDLTRHSVTEKTRQLLIGGDMNATADYGKSLIGGKSAHLVKGANDNGERLNNFITINKLALVNTWFEHKKLHSDTWYSNTGKTSKTIDYVTSSPWLMQYISDCRVRNSYTFNNSDHRLLVCRMKTPRRKVDRKRFVKKTKQSRFDVNSLKDQYVRSGFVNKVDELCSQINSKYIKSKDFKKLVETLEVAAKHCLPNAVKSAEACLWDNDRELNDLLALRDHIDRNQNKIYFHEITNKIRKRFDYIRNIFYAEQAESVNEAHEARNLEKKFRLARSITTTKKPVAQLCPGLKEHFSAHFSHPPPSDVPPEEILKPPDYISRLQATGMDLKDTDEYIKNPPKADEISKTMKKLKNGKSSTDVPPEFLKVCSDTPNFIAMLESLFAEVWDDIIIPTLWRKTTITALYKSKKERWCKL